MSAESEIRKAIKNLIETMDSGDANLNKKAFHIKSRGYFFMMGKDKSYPIIREEETPHNEHIHEDWEARETTFIDTAGDAAYAIVEWRNPTGNRPQNRPNDIFIDYYPMLKIDNAWKVTALSDELIREGVIYDGVKNDEEGIKKTLQIFYDSFDSCDYELMKTVFHNDVRIFGNNDNFKQGLDFDSWCGIICQSPEIFERKLLTSVINNTIAFAKVKWSGASQSFTDYYTFMLVNGTWIITNKTFSIFNE